LAQRFERAASLGEETDNPRRNIPRAIATAVLTMGVFYTIVMLAQTLGFGVDKQGTESFAGSSSPVGTFPGATWDLSWPTS
jgi:amino acid transporter